MRLLFLTCLTLLVSGLKAQFTVQVQVNVVQPVPPYLPQIKADIAGNRAGMLNQDISSHLSIVLRFTGRAQQRIKLAGSIERVAPSPMGVSLRPDYQPAQPITMGPQLSIVSLTKDMLLSAFGNFTENSLVWNNMDLGTLRQNLIDYKLPEGTYRVCVTAYDYDRPGLSAPLSAPGTGCAYFTICYTAAAPQLILPVSTMMQSNSQFQDFIPHSPQVQFLWTPPATTCGTPVGALNYDLEIRRVFDGQTVTDAQANPYVFHQQNIPATTFFLDTLKYPHVLVPGQKYTIRVKANFTPMPGSPLEIANQGYSQVAAINYERLPAPPAQPAQPIAFLGDSLPAKPTTIKGKLAYRFPGDTSNLVFPVAREKVYLEKVYMHAGKDANGLQTYTPLSAAEQASLPPYQDMLDGMITQTDDAGNFQLQCGMTSLDSSGVVPDAKFGLLYSATYNGNAEYVRGNAQNVVPLAAQSLKGNLACLYKVITTNPHYRPYAQYLDITPGGVRDLTSLVLDANSYTLNVNVREVFNDQLGNFASGAEVRIYRLTSNKKDGKLGIPLYEGDILDSARDWKEAGDKVLIEARTTPTPPQPSTDPKVNTVRFLRLFRSVGSDPYNYIICLEKGGVVLSQVTYSSLMGTPAARSAAAPSSVSALFALRSNLQDEWSDYAYKGAPDTVTLTLEKQLIAPPHSLVTGTLKYQYKSDLSTPAQPYANMPVRLMVYYVFKGQSTGAPQGTTGKMTTATGLPVFYAQIATTYANQDSRVVNPSPGSGTALFTTANGQITDNGKVLATVNTDANGKFSFDFENIDSTMQTMQGKLVTGIKPGYLPSGQSQSGQFTRVYRVVPGISYYCAPDNDIPVQPWGSYDCGTLTSFVHTYNLRVTTLDRDAGHAMINVPVNLCRYANDPYSSEQPINPAGSAFLNTPISLSGSSSPGGTAATGAGSGTNNRFMQVNFTLPVSYPLSSALVKRTGATDNNGIVVFNNVVVSTDGQKDLWIVQADGSATQRAGALTFATAYQVIPKDFTYSGPTLSYNGLPGESSANASAYAGGYANFPPYSDPSLTVFNSELNTNQTWGDTLYVKPDPPRYAGRVIDSFSTLGIPNITVSLLHTDEYGYSGFYDRGHVWAAYEFNATTDANGYFDETQYSGSYAKDDSLSSPDKLEIDAPGYKSFTTSVQALSMGQQLYQEIRLSPLATNSFGYVADSSNPSIAVTARVKLKVNGIWVDTYSYSGDPNKPASTGTGLVTNGTYKQMLNLAAASAVSPTPDKPSSSGKSPSAPAGASRMLAFGNLQVQVDKTGGITGMTIKQTGNTNAGPWQDVVNAFNGKPQAINRPAPSVSGVQRFDIDLPAIVDSIIIMPYDPAYLTRSFAVHPTGPGQNLGTFLLPPRVHHVLVQVTAAAQQPAKGAMVSIDGVPGTRTVNSRGQVQFDFVNNALTDFMVRVRPNDSLRIANSSAYTVFTPVSVEFTSVDDGSVNYVPVRVSAGQIVSGKVTFDNTGKPVKDAVVYVDQGTGSNSEINANSDSSGTYRLIGVPLSLPSLVIKAAYSAPGNTYTGDQQTLAGSTAPGPVNLVIHTLAGIDMSRLYGFPARLSKATKNSDGTYTIDGEIYGLPANANFAPRTDIPTAALTFSGLKVKASSLADPSGTPMAVPLGDSIAFDNLTLSVNAFKVFDAQVSAVGGGSLSIRKAASDTAGVLNGQARIVDNSFNFPSSYMTISNTDFYLGNYGQPAGKSKLVLPVFPSDAGHYALTKFSITTANAGAIAFKYLGFNGLTETQGSRESFVMGDSVNLFLNLTTTIQNNINLQFNAGKAVIRHDGISRMVNDDSLSFNLEQWTVSSHQWELSPASGGIRISNGMLHTGKADLPFTDMSIIAGDPAGELSCNSLTSDALQQAADKGLLTIGNGIAKLKLYSGTGVTFVYDPDAGAVPGHGHFKLTLQSNNGTAAYFGGLDGMTNASQRFSIQFLSELSDGEEIFAFDPKAQPVTFYNQVQFMPQTLTSLDGRLVMQGMVNTNITNLPQNIDGVFTFDRATGSPASINKLSISPLVFSFTGDGGTQFRTSGLPGTQLFNQYGIGIGGITTIPGVDGTFPSNLVSMVTSNAAAVIPASGDAVSSLTGAIGAAQQNIKQQAEVWLGDVTGQAQAFADQAADQVTGLANDARNALVSQLNKAANTLGQNLPIGAAGQQIANLAGKWRLMGDGIDAIKDFNNNPAGSLMRLNGDLQGFTGINVASEASQRLQMVANQALSGLAPKLPVDKIADAAGSAASTFNGMHFDFDLKNGRITGSLSIPELDFGAVVLNNLGIEMLMDKQGWYFYTGAGMDLPQSVPLHPLLFPLSVGIIIGSYPTISPDLTSRITENSFVKKLPSTFSQGIHGFFMTGKKDILQPTSLKIDFEIVNFEIGASAGLDARMYANFGDKSQQIGIAGMEFGSAFASLDVLGTCGVSGNADLNVGLKATFTNDQKGFTLKAAACASVTVAGSAWCGVGPAQVSGSFSKSIMGILTLCAGADCNKAIDLSLYLNGGSCSASNDFDY